MADIIADTVSVTNNDAIIDTVSRVLYKKLKERICCGKTEPMSFSAPEKPR